jgi:hypothetical protein
VLASPRNHQDPAVASIGCGGFVLVGDGEDLSQGTDQDNIRLASIFASTDQIRINYFTWRAFMRPSFDFISRHVNYVGSSICAIENDVTVLRPNGIV